MNRSKLGEIIALSSRLSLWTALAAGAFFRLWRLGASPMRSDTIEFWRICSLDIGAGAIFRRWLELLGVSGAMPFPLALTRFFLDAFDLPLTLFTIRLPSALWGIAAIPLAWVAGRRFAGRSGANIMCWLVALHPALVQWSREAYFYPPVFAGSLLTFWALLLATDVALGKDNPHWSHPLIAVAGFVLLTYSLPTTWFFAFLAAVFFLASLAWRAYRGTCRPRWPVVSAGLFLIAGLPLLFSGWGLRHLIAYSQQRMMGADEWPVLPVLYRFVTINGWGGNAWRAPVTLLLLAAGLLFLLSRARFRPRGAPLLAALGAGVVLVLVSCISSGQPFAQRYLLHLVPGYLLLLTGGLLWLMRKLPVLANRYGFLPVRWVNLLPVILLAALVHPVLLSARLEGKPTPYFKVNNMLDSLLPAGTPVVVDRWLEAGNEFRVHSPERVFVTYIIPDEPLDVFLEHDWRATARRFFEENPWAAFMEVTKNHWREPGVGRWDWPRQHFARRAAVTNVPGMKLRDMGLAARGGFYGAHTNRIVVEVFYNTRDDIVGRARKDGRPLLALPGSGWGYTKTGDHRGWMVLEQAATLELYNLTAGSRRVVLELLGAAPGGSKRLVWGGGQELELPRNELGVYTLGPFDLPPGRHTLVMQDPLWSAGRVPLLLNRFLLRPADRTEGR